MDMDKKPPSFVVDSMLGKLARWLRILGFDTLYFRDVEDEELLKISEEGGRYLLTRDRELYHRASPRGVLISEMGLDGQLKEVALALSLYKYDLPTRCPLCNTVLRRAERESVRGAVPEGTLEHYREYYICPGCGKIYWHGSHWGGIVRRAEEAGFNTQSLTEDDEE
ncbi:MAG: hypothetical protein DRN35_04510 [Thermoplasmata archaeon]|nr:MAG: hypothetical protein DRN35_04510 [Thermoplasmata archaeon]RLF71012.1 MAG: hypothetical protein DRN40_03370 [Thermoplasmata archaeon]RLF72915.1 MAG: hypothetical protein DRN55_05105 [Thermoplasmata archaeon]RLF74419.1 MAG: hypothetical protein DRN42_04700 [Thermoplasmata archaeon]HDD60613.1 hypothetical protein [Euryarchaeota archaeon]